MSAFAVRECLNTSRDLRVEDLGDGIRRLVFTRPERRNAFDPEMILQLVAALNEMASEPDPARMRLLVLAGEGKAFSAGADLNYMKRLADAGEQESLEDARILASLFYRLASFPTPVVARVQGAAIGGGLGLVVCSDVVVAEPSALFQTSEVRLGIVPGVISPYIVRRVGLAQASPFMLMGRRVGADEARSMGLVQVVSGPDALDAALDAVIVEFLRTGPQASHRTKELLLSTSPLPAPAVVEASIQAIAKARCSSEGRAGLQSFFDKKPPPWSETATRLGLSTKSNTN